MAEKVFLKGKFVKIVDGKCSRGETIRDTLVALDDICRVRACKVVIYEGTYGRRGGKIIGSETALVVTAIKRSQSSSIYENDKDHDYYVLTDPTDYIANVLGRDPEELAAMLLELECGE